MISRRTLMALPMAAAAARAAGHAMQMELSCGALGIRASQRAAIDLAARHGFDVVDADGSYLGGLAAGELHDLLDAMRAKHIGWAPAGLAGDPKTLPAYAAGLRRAGVPSAITWVDPGSNDLPYAMNFQQTAARLREAASVLDGAGVRLGIEYVGTKTAWAGKRYPFIHNMAQMRELIAEIGRTNVGLVLDSWHWYQAGDTGAEIRALRPRDVVSVDLNDAPRGIAKDRMVDDRRELPAATGIIDGKTFLAALQHIGYTGPVRAEPFNEAVRRMTPDEAAEAAADSLRKAFRAAGI